MRGLWQALADVFSQFKTAEFWIAIMLIAFFSVLAYFLVHYAFLTDNILIDTQGARCMPLNNRSVLFLMFSMIFFAFTAVLMLGELQNYFNFKGEKDEKNATKSLAFSAAWGFVSTGLATGVLIFFSRICW